MTTAVPTESRIQQTRAAAARPQNAAAEAGRRALVLDDEVALAQMLAEVLDVLGYTSTLCHSPVQALELIERQHFDLIISDFRMPGLNGQQFYEMVKQNRPALARRIVFL